MTIDSMKDTAQWADYPGALPLPPYHISHNY